MSRPAVEVADLLREQGDRFIDRSPWLSYQQLSVLRAIRCCRTAALGGHIDRCSQCGHQAISYNSCRNRHCPKCQAQSRHRWLAAREKELLDVPYFHVVFTLPNELNPLCWRNAPVLYDLLFRASADTMMEVAANPRRLGAQIGFISILHTWGQNLLLHPHVHCVVPAGGLSASHDRWIHPKYAFFLPVNVLSTVFRAKFCGRTTQGVPPEEADLYRLNQSTRQSEAIRGFYQLTLQETVGGIREADVRRPSLGAPLPWQVYTPGRNQQPPAAGL